MKKYQNDQFKYHNYKVSAYTCTNKVSAYNDKVAAYND